MPLNTWDEDIVIAELDDEPLFSEDMDNLHRLLEEAAKDEAPLPCIIVDLKSVTTVNSSNLGALLKLRTTLQQANKRLVICSVTEGVWAALLATGLDRVFVFTKAVDTAIARIKLEC